MASQTLNASWQRLMPPLREVWGLTLMVGLVFLELLVLKFFFVGGLGNQGAKVLVHPKGICFSIPPNEIFSF